MSAHCGAEGAFLGGGPYGPDAYREACAVKDGLKLESDDLFLLVVDGNVYDHEDDEYFFITGADRPHAEQHPSRVGIISLFFLNPKSTFMRDGGKWWESLGKAKQAKKKSDCVLLLILGAVAQEITGLSCHREMRGCIMDYCQDPTEIVEAATGAFRFCAQECFPALSQSPEGRALLAIAKSLSEAPLSVRVLEPELSVSPLSAGAVVISIHGIRARGAWQKMLGSELNKAGFPYEALDYGFFGAVRLLFPGAREKQVRWFVDEYTRIRQGSTAKISVIAHSFGTYIVAGALEKYAEVNLDSIIFCGSIVRPDYAWSRLIPGQAKRVLNDFGRLDRWVKLVAWFIGDAGPSGARGFDDEAGGHVQQRLRPKFRHSDYFYRLNYQGTWIPFLRGEPPHMEPGDERWSRNWRFLVTKAAIVMILFGLGLVIWRLTR